MHWEAFTWREDKIPLKVISLNFVAVAAVVDVFFFVCVIVVLCFPL